MSRHKSSFKVGELSHALAARLSRRTTSGQFIPEVDGLRFIAIILVVVHHLAGYLGERSPTLYQPPASEDWIKWAAQCGRFGVEIFFVISGFVLALPFARRHLCGTPRLDLRRYYLRRVTRLEPPYILSLLGVVVFRAIVNGESLSTMWPHFVASCLYVHNIMFDRGSVLNGVAWSLEVEIQFYVLAPLLASVFAIRRREVRRGLLLGLIVTVGAMQAWHPMTSGIVRLTIVNFIQFFLAGFLLCDFYLLDWANPSERKRLWGVVAVAGWPALWFIWSSEALTALFFAPATLLLFAAVFRAGTVSSVFKSRWIVTIGGMCYSIYLLHYPLISAIARRTVHVSVSHSFGVDLLVQVLLVTPLVLVLCGVYFALVERPCMDPQWPSQVADLCRRWARRMPRAQVQGAEVAYRSEAAGSVDERAVSSRTPHPTSL